MEKNRLYYLTFAQIISMILIVLSHSLPKNVDVPLFIRYITPYLQHAGLTVFMWISAYLTIITDQLGKYGYKRFVLRRFIRLLIPYFAVGLLLLLPKYMFSEFTNNGVSLDPMAVFKQLLIPRDGLMPHLWFLPTLFILSVFLPIWKKLSENYYVVLVALVGLLLISPYKNEITNIGGLRDVFIYAFWFLGGVSYATWEERIKMYRIFNYILALFFIIGIGLCFWKGIGGFYNIAYRLVMLILIISISKIMETKTINISEKLGKYTFSIYIVSLPIQNIVNLCCVTIGIHVIVIWIINFLTGFFFSFWFAKCVEWIEKKCRINFFSRIIGL